jgi:AcrR family transcriptional regulator
MSISTSKKKKTKDRILDTALDLFNLEGEPNVTTNAIADEMDISPGNLHYHFKTKADLVQALFTRFEREVSSLFSLIDEEKVDIVEAWMKISLLFEIMWAYRFAYRDLAQLLAKYPPIRRSTAQLLHHKISVAEQGCGILGISRDSVDVSALARNIVVLMTYWISFELACGVDGEDRSRFGRGAYQVTQLLLPHLDETATQAIRDLAGEYLEV